MNGVVAGFDDPGRFEFQCRIDDLDRALVCTCELHFDSRQQVVDAARIESNATPISSTG